MSIGPTMRPWLVLILVTSLLAGCSDEVPAEAEPEPLVEESVSEPYELSAPFGFMVGAGLPTNAVNYAPVAGALLIAGNGTNTVTVDFTWDCPVPVCPLTIQLRNGGTYAEVTGDQPLSLALEDVRAGSYDVMAWPDRPGVAASVSGTAVAIVTPNAD